METDGLAQLRKRVEAATGPDRTIDLLIGLTIDGWQIGNLIDGRFFPILGGTLVRDSSGNINVAAPGGMYPAPTESIDASLALVQRKLPGWSLHIHVHPDEAHADLYRLGDLVTKDGQLYRPVTAGPFDAGPLPTLPLAILSALISALAYEKQSSPTPETA